MVTKHHSQKNAKILSTIAVGFVIMASPTITQEIINQLGCTIHQMPPHIACANSTTYYVIGSGWGSSIPWQNIEIWKPHFNIPHNWLPGIWTGHY